MPKICLLALPYLLNPFLSCLTLVSHPNAGNKKVAVNSSVSLQIRPQEQPNHCKGWIGHAFDVQIKKLECAHVDPSCSQTCILHDKPSLHAVCWDLSSDVCIILDTVFFRHHFIIFLNSNLEIYYSLCLVLSLPDWQDLYPASSLCLQSFSVIEFLQ